jgi:deoxyribodipyrimidine photo-lyase
MRTLIYWFKNDLRLIDNPALLEACNCADRLLPIYIHLPQAQAAHVFGFPREGFHRKAFLRESLKDLRLQLRALGSDLLEYAGEPADILAQLAQDTHANAVYCERIEAPEEIRRSQQILERGITIQEFWQSSMLSPESLPFTAQDMPDMFTQFRKKVEYAGLNFSPPVIAPSKIPALPELAPIPLMQSSQELDNSMHQFLGGERNALEHLKQYLARRLPDTYKETRNQLIGQDYSSKFSPYLALGCVSARTIVAKLDVYEQTHGANDGTYWLWFELLWRDYFRFLHFKYGTQLYREAGLSDTPMSKGGYQHFESWRTGSTGKSLIDAGMRELLKTGYLSNRMRQIVASYWIYDLQGDWRLGAAWFESQLIDYDVYSNQGNWLYLAGLGTDPRGGRRFNIAKQEQDHDPRGEYQRLWL